MKHKEISVAGKKIIMIYDKMINDLYNNYFVRISIIIKKNIAVSFINKVIPTITKQNPQANYNYVNMTNFLHLYFYHFFSI